MNPSNDIVKVFSILEIARDTGLPLGHAYVNRQHYLGEKYRAADYKDFGKGLLRWAEDFAYVRNPLTNKFEPLVWIDWQVHETLRLVVPSENDKTKFKYLTLIICWPRRKGKTLWTSIFDVWRADQFENQKIIIAANSENQATSTAFELCVSICEHSPILAKKFGKLDIGINKIYFPHTNSEIVAVPRSIPSMYGQSVNVGQTTELCVAKDDSHFQVLASSTGDVQGIMLVDSNFGATSNKVYELFDLARQGQDPTIGVSLIAYKDIDEAIEYNLSPYITEKWLRSRKMQMTSGEFKRNHLNQPSEGAEQMFTADQIAACETDWEYPLSVNFIADLFKKRYYWHIFGGGHDGAMAFSKRGDRTVWSYVAKGHLTEEIMLTEYDDQLQWLDDEDEELKDKIRAYTEPFEYVLLESDEIRNSDVDAEKRIIRHCAEKYGKPQNIVLEAYQAAGLFQWCGQNNFKSDLISPGTNVQVAMFNYFYQVIAARRFKILKGQWLIKTELGLFQADEVNNKFGLGKQVRLTVPLEQKIDVMRNPLEPEIVKVKDDAVYSAAHAVYGLRDQEFVPTPVARVYSG